jgi:hypothetical protein
LSAAFTLAALLVVIAIMVLLIAVLYHSTPGPGEPPTLSGAASETVNGYSRWTRKGLLGVDFGGSEVR